MTTTTAIVEEHRIAAKRLRKKLLEDPQAARKFLIRAGILAKGGLRLAKRYR
jgi:hypothetical protein